MIISGRYAEAFLEYAKETIGFDNGLEELLNLKTVFHDNPELEEILKSPVISYSEKCETIKKVLGKNFSQELCQLLRLLLHKNRIDLVNEIAEYARIKYHHANEADALLKISYPIDTELMEKIKNVLEEKLHKKLHLYIDLDPSLLGGMRLAIGNTIIDGSVRKRLDELKEKLLTVKVN